MSGFSPHWPDPLHLYNDNALDDTYRRFYLSDYGIVGCNAGPRLDDGRENPSWIIQTCDESAYDGWVKFEFNLHRYGSADLTPFTFADFQFSLGAFGTGQCHFTESGQSGCVESPYATVTPEPATLTLMGSGLAGLLGFARRRRSRKS